MSNPSGRYLWRGETLSDEPDFFNRFMPSFERLSQAIPYLASPPGWHFLFADGHEDVWFDSEVLDE